MLEAGHTRLRLERYGISHIFELVGEQRFHEAKRGSESGVQAGGSVCWKAQWPERADRQLAVGESIVTLTMAGDHEHASGGTSLLLLLSVE